MNDEEIMKRFNETFSDDVPASEAKKPEEVTPYKATVNQNVVPTDVTVPTSTNNDIPPLNNTASAPTTENPTVEKEEVKKENVDSNKMMEPDKNNYSNQEVNNNDKASNVNYNYVPTYDSKQKKTISIKISPELKPVIIIVIILFVVIMIIPNVYDFFTHIK